MTKNSAYILLILIIAGTLFFYYRTPAKPLSVCKVDALKTLASWQGAAGNRVGAIEFANISDDPCYFEGYPDIEIKDSSGLLLKTEQRKNEGTVEKIILEPKQMAFVNFSWNNWCGKTPNLPISFQVTIGDIRNYLVVPATNLRGGFLTDMPACTNATLPSLFSFGPFSHPQ